ncbi:hypothetical protein BDQ12DRAFT_611775 [Crucibulum laeve]|uniref:Uncharacterized protein n=1 Tax=Crucibulum laeve TaxID=68775 RepID=A0A5C3LRQ2_9AGAR|nr:hypothetical protein BDQ12DRAFT_611775 [Crucibulum laeve]
MSYIRTIQTTWSAAHQPHSSWAASSSSRVHHAPHSTVLLNIGANAHHNYPLNQTPQYTQQYHGYTHSGQAKYPPGLGRRRSSAVSRPQRIKFDPFADEPSAAQQHQPQVSRVSPMLYNNPPTHHHSHNPAASRPYTIQIPEAPQQQRDKEARAKIVAGILLNRVHAVGKPMRRRPGMGSEPRAYVKSGLSSVVSCEA